jgi:cation transport regulator ChaB
MPGCAMRTTLSRREEIAHRVAWAAVKRRYRKRGDAWVPKGTV